jgi:hypothetical protein
VIADELGVRMGHEQAQNLPPLAAGADAAAAALASGVAAGEPSGVHPAGHGR